MIRRLALVCAMSLRQAMPVRGQVVNGAFARELRGCWAITVGTFTGSPVDSGMTTLPNTVRLDTLSGPADFAGYIYGWRVEAVPLTPTTIHGVGSFVKAGTDSVVLSFSTGFTGLDILVAKGAKEMKGEATLWTDYGTSQRAPIALHRIRCP
jgi:hypothetical protein